LRADGEYAIWDVSQSPGWEPVVGREIAAAELAWTRGGPGWWCVASTALRFDLGTEIVIRLGARVSDGRFVGSDAARQPSSPDRGLIAVVDFDELYAAARRDVDADEETRTDIRRWRELFFLPVDDAIVDVLLSAYLAGRHHGGEWMTMQETARASERSAQLAPQRRAARAYTDPTGGDQRSHRSGLVRVGGGWDRSGRMGR
jgi:hypothetical protein